MVQSADDVQFRATLPLRLRRALENLLVRHDIALRALQVSSERAENAAVDAHIRWIEMLIDVVIRPIAILALADEIGQLAEREQVGVLFQMHAVVEREALAGFNLLADSG